MSRLSSVLIAVGLVSLPAVSARAVTTYMPVGDSITEGKFANGGYRLPLQNKLAANGLTFDFVGKEDDGMPGNDTGFSVGMADPNHEGYGSFRVDETLNGSSEEGHTAPAIATTLANYNPNVVLLMIGTNDILQGRDPTQSSQTLDTLVGTILQTDSGVHLLLASITPIANTGLDAQAIAYNSFIPGIVTTYKSQGYNVTFVDMHSALNTSTDLSDGVHPTAAGFQKMADAWYAAAVPEPSSIASLAVAGLGLLGRRRNRS